MTATCASPAIRIGAVSHTARSARRVTVHCRVAVSSASGGPCPLGPYPFDSTNAAAHRKTRQRRASLPIRRARPASTICQQSPPPPGTILASSCAGVRTGWVRITGGGVVAILLASVPFWSDDRRRGARFVATALGSFLFQQVLIARALDRHEDGEPEDLDAVDALTLSRGLAASIVAASALAGPRHRGSYAAKIAWPLAVSGSTLTDWIDGPLARRRGRGPTRLGRVLDLELDSWLTLATTFGGTRLGTLDALCLITPSLRYLAMASPIPYEDVHAVGKSDRARNLGITQMALALASFAPFAGAATTAIARVASLVLLPIHVVALAAALPIFRRER
jgi:phosphatidylglycerophosphate synthase